MTGQTAARDRVIEVDRIVASIDWEPTCLPGREQHAIVEQVLRLRALTGAPAPNAVDRLVAAAEGLEAIDWHGTAYDLRDIASQLTPGDPKSDDGVGDAAAVVARALAGAPTADVAALLARCDELDRLADQRDAEITRGERHGPPIFRSLHVREIRLLLAAAPEGVDVADEQDASRCPVCEKPLRLCCYMCPDGAHDDDCEGMPDDDGMDLEAQGEMGDQLDAAQAQVRTLSRMLRGMARRVRERRLEMDAMADGGPCKECYDLGFIPADKSPRDADGAPYFDQDQPCPQGCEVSRWLLAERAELTAAQAAIQRVRAVLDRPEDPYAQWPQTRADLEDEIRSALDGDTAEEQR